VPFSWNGTFNKSQFDRFIAFARSQIGLIDARIAHLEAEKLRIGVPVFKYGSDGLLQGYSADPPNSYIAKLLVAYEVQGGDPFLDLTLRTRNDPVYKLRGDQGAMPQLMSNGEVIGAPGLADAASAQLMRLAREWLEATLDARMGNLERKIRRVLDYYDQLDEEGKLLGYIKMSPETAGSLEFVAKGIEDLFSDGTYRPISNDNKGDPGAMLTYAPFSAYDTGPDSPGEVADSFRRQDNGAKRKGEA